MPKTFINGNADLPNYLNKDLPPGDWVEVTQDMIDKFAEISGSSQETFPVPAPPDAPDSATTGGSAVAVVSMDDAGDPAAAAALCTLILVTSIAVRVATDLAAKRLWRRSQSWRAA